MTRFIAEVERCAETGLYVGFVRGLPSAHSQGASLKELKVNLIEVVEMLLEEKSRTVEYVEFERLALVQSPEGERE